MIANQFGEISGIGLTVNLPHLPIWQRLRNLGFLCSLNFQVGLALREISFGLSGALLRWGYIQPLINYLQKSARPVLNEHEYINSIIVLNLVWRNISWYDNC